MDTDIRNILTEGDMRCRTQTCQNVVSALSVAHGLTNCDPCLQRPARQAKALRAKADLIDSVMRYIYNNKDVATERLFPGDAASKAAYRQSWMKLDVYAYWCRLDLDNRDRLVQIAIEHYAR